MPNSTDKIVAALEALLKKKGTQKPTDRLGLERPVFSRDLDNRPMAGWEKAAALLGAAVSPGSTIASMVLAPPQEETLFDRAIKGPDGKTQYLQVYESVVPRMRKAARKSVTPNPVVAALQRAVQKGPLADPANDLLHQKINDRDFLVHATRPESAKKIRDSGGILPGEGSEVLPEKVLNDPVIREMLRTGKIDFYRFPFSGNMQLDAGKHLKFSLNPKQPVGIPGAEPSISPGVSFSRQMSVPALNDEKNYRLLLDPKARKTFSTSEPGFGKAGFSEVFKPKGLDRFESEQRTYGMPYPVKPANRAVTTDVPTLATEERVAPKNVDRYRATMGNETVKTIIERLGTKTKSVAELKAEYKVLKDKADILWQKLQESGLTPEYSNIANDWLKAKELADSAFDIIYK